MSALVKVAEETNVSPPSIWHVSQTLHCLHWELQHSPRCWIKHFLRVLRGAVPHYTVSSAVLKFTEVTTTDKSLVLTSSRILPRARMNVPVIHFWSNLSWGFVEFLRGCRFRGNCVLVDTPGDGCWSVIQELVWNAWSTLCWSCPVGCHPNYKSAWFESNPAWYPG